MDFKKYIFIHIPKTGGTSMRPIFSEGQQKFYYTQMEYFRSKRDWDTFGETWKRDTDSWISEVHIDESDYTTPTLSDLCYNNFYDEFGFFTLLRNPVERLISEYYFFSDDRIMHSFRSLRPDITKKLYLNNNIKSYAENRLTFNTQTKFLLGIGHLTDYDVTENDYDRLIKRIDSLDFKVGILERLSDTLLHFGLESWPDEDIPHLRKGKNRQYVDDDIRKIIKDNNNFDFRLYNYYLNKL